MVAAAGADAGAVAAAATAVAAAATAAAVVAAAAVAAKAAVAAAAAEPYFLTYFHIDDAIILHEKCGFGDFPPVKIEGSNLVVDFVS